MTHSLILASESPRRSELLTQAGIPFTVLGAHAKEISEGEPREVVLHNAIAKASAVQALCPGKVVLGADTIVCLDGRIYGKPKDEADARHMLESLSGKWNDVYTGVAVIDSTGRLHTMCDVTSVHFIEMTEAEISAYIQSGEPFGKAGAYAVQGKAGYFIDRIEGSYSNVVGLPLTAVREILKSIDEET